MSRQDRLNWQIRYAGREMTHGQASEFADLFGAVAAAHYDDDRWRDRWVSTLQGVTMVADRYLPFRDNVDHAASAGVVTIVESGGSSRTHEVAEAAASYGINHIQTGLRLFHH